MAATEIGCRIDKDGEQKVCVAVKRPQRFLLTDMYLQIKMPSVLTEQLEDSKWGDENEGPSQPLTLVTTPGETAKETDSLPFTLKGCFIRSRVESGICIFSKLPGGPESGGPKTTQFRNTGLDKYQGLCHLPKQWWAGLWVPGSGRNPMLCLKHS